MNNQTYIQSWFGNIRGDILSGIVVAMALIPEAIAFSIIAGVDPMVGLYASFCIAIVISFVGGRPGMISAATGAMALVMVDLVKDHGLEYMLAATILTGVVQIVFGVLKIGNLMKFIPSAVMIGFVNSLAILIFMAQLPHFIGESWPMYAMVGGSLAIIYLFPRLTKAVPSPLIAIIIITLIAVFTGSDVRTVGDMGTLSQKLPSFLIPNIPFNFDTLAIILPYSLALALVGLLESLLTSQIVDDLTDTASPKNKEARGQGIANIVAGFFGGMAGCAMIGQSGINIRSGGRGRLSTFIAGAFLMVLIVLLNNVLISIPMAALVGVMIMVSIGTFDWSTFKRIKMMPKGDAAVLIVTMATVIVTHDLSKGVIAGVILSALFFASKISNLQVESYLEDQNRKRVYQVRGQLFFASVSSLRNAFDFTEEIDEVIIDLTHSHVWDHSGVDVLDKTILKFKERNILVRLVGMNLESTLLVNQVSVTDQSMKKASGH